MSKEGNEKIRKPASRRFYNRVVKRSFDVIISALGLIVLSPLMLITAILIRMTSQGPAIFRQKRIGRGAKVFTIYKFRTMKLNSEHSGYGVYSDDHDPRMTWIGKILRKLSIDELPQLYNILKGDMSLIGPRPPLTYHPWPLAKYTWEQRRMFELRPGITGWAQIHGRKAVEWNKRIELNVWYVDHVSFLLDLKIFFITIGKVFTGADNENKGATVINDGAERGDTR
jgi:lipopolysaccharide/colanic/teichoic acid biosynthesis glycosyltransferase